jgi:hypothetical protein
MQDATLWCRTVAVKCPGHVLSALNLDPQLNQHAKETRTETLPLMQDMSTNLVFNRTGNERTGKDPGHKLTVPNWMRQVPVASRLWLTPSVRAPTKPCKTGKYSKMPQSGHSPAASPYRRGCTLMSQRMPQVGTRPTWTLRQPTIRGEPIHSCQCDHTLICHREV